MTEADTKPWVEHVQAAEEQWVSLLCLDGDVLVESLASLPADLHGRLLQISDYANHVRNTASHGQSAIVDTGLGTASWVLKFGPSSSEEDDSQGQTRPGQSSQAWADQQDDQQPQQPLSVQGPDAAALPQTQVQTDVQPTPLLSGGPVSKAFLKAKDGHAGVVVKNPPPRSGQPDTDTAQAPQTAMAAQEPPVKPKPQTPQT